VVSQYLQRFRHALLCNQGLELNNTTHREREREPGLSPEVGMGLGNRTTSRDGGRVPIPGGVQKTCRCGTLGHGLGGVVVLG